MTGEQKSLRDLMASGKNYVIKIQGSNIESLNPWEFTISGGRLINSSYQQPLGGHLRVNAEFDFSIDQFFASGYTLAGVTEAILQESEGLILTEDGFSYLQKD